LKEIPGISLLRLGETTRIAQRNRVTLFAASPYRSGVS
jgi:hypothetical protein